MRSMLALFVIPIFVFSSPGVFAEDAPVEIQCQDIVGGVVEKKADGDQVSWWVQAKQWITTICSQTTDWIQAQSARFLSAERIVHKINTQYLKSKTRTAFARELVRHDFKLYETHRRALGLSSSQQVAYLKHYITTVFSVINDHEPETRDQEALLFLNELDGMLETYDLAKADREELWSFLGELLWPEQGAYHVEQIAPEMLMGLHQRLGGSLQQMMQVALASANETLLRYLLTKQSLENEAWMPFLRRPQTINALLRISQNQLSKLGLSETQRLSLLVEERAHFPKSESVRDMMARFELSANADWDAVDLPLDPVQALEKWSIVSPKSPSRLAIVRVNLESYVTAHGEQASILLRSVHPVLQDLLKDSRVALSSFAEAVSIFAVHMGEELRFEVNWRTLKETIGRRSAIEFAEFVGSHQNWFFPSPGPEFFKRFNGVEKNRLLQAFGVELKENAPSQSVVRDLREEEEQRRYNSLSAPKRLAEVVSLFDSLNSHGIELTVESLSSLTEEALREHGLSNVNLGSVRKLADRAARLMRAQDGLVALQAYTRRPKQSLLPDIAERASRDEEKDGERAATINAELQNLRAGFTTALLADAFKRGNVTAEEFAAIDYRANNGRGAVSLEPFQAVFLGLSQEQMNFVNSLDVQAYYSVSKANRKLVQSYVLEDQPARMRLEAVRKFEQTRPRLTVSVTITQKHFLKSDVMRFLKSASQIESAKETQRLIDLMTYLSAPEESFMSFDELPHELRHYISRSAYEFLRQRMKYKVTSFFDEANEIDKVRKAFEKAWQEGDRENIWLLSEFSGHEGDVAFRFLYNGKTYQFIITAYKVPATLLSKEPGLLSTFYPLMAKEFRPLLFRHAIPKLRAALREWEADLAAGRVKSTDPVRKVIQNPSDLGFIGFD